MGHAHILGGLAAAHLVIACTTAGAPPVAPRHVSMAPEPAPSAPLVAPAWVEAPAPAPPPSVEPPAPEPQMVGSYLTRLHGTRNRVHNIRVAAEALDGVVLQTSETLSFNDRVGRRSRRRGYRKAPVIVEGELEEGWGGGVCQVASTLHAAALVAGLEIVEARPHSRPTPYLPLGMDAAVAWPSRDVKIRNPYPFDVTIHTTTTRRQIQVDLVGTGAVPPVAIERRVLRRFRPSTEERPVARLAPGEREIVREGIRGALVRLTRTWDVGSEPIVEERIVRYPATPEVVEIGMQVTNDDALLWEPL